MAVSSSVRRSSHPDAASTRPWASPARRAATQLVLLVVESGGGGGGRGGEWARAVAFICVEEEEAAGAAATTGSGGGGGGGCSCAAAACAVFFLRPAPGAMGTRKASKAPFCLSGTEEEAAFFFFFFCVLPLAAGMVAAAVEWGGRGVGERCGARGGWAKWAVGWVGGEARSSNEESTSQWKFGAMPNEIGATQRNRGDVEMPFGLGHVVGGGGKGMYARPGAAPQGKPQAHHTRIPHTLVRSP